jgi:hypothetical protein
MSGQSRELKRLCTFPRDKGEAEVRWSFDEFAANDGKSSKYISGRKWYRAGDEWRPTKAGLTIRLGELDEVVTQLQRVQRARDQQSTGNDAADRRKQHRELMASTTTARPTPEELEEIF